MLQRVRFISLVYFFESLYPLLLSTSTVFCLISNKYSIFEDFEDFESSLISQNVASGGAGLVPVTEQSQ